MKKPGFLRFGVGAMIADLVGVAALLCVVHEGELETC
jgi:hypothetical protein